MPKRRRGSAIVDTSKGVLLTAMAHGPFLLPGGGAKKGETRFMAAIRELQEETGLLAHSARILFNHESQAHEHTVVLIEAEGEARPRMEVKRLAYYKPGMKIEMSTATREILDKYYEWKKSKH